MGSVSNFIKFLFPELILLFLCCLGILQIKEKASLPFALEASQNQLIISDAYSGSSSINNGDILLSVNHHNFSSLEEIEVVLDGKKPGEQVPIKYKHAGVELSDEVILNHYYSSFDLIIYSFSGLFFLTVGLITIIKSNNKKTARLFYWGCSGAALIITMTPGSYELFSNYIGFITRFIFHLAYCITPVIFVHFILNFPQERKNKTPIYIVAAYSFAVILSVILSYTFIKGVINNSTEQISDYIWIYDNILRVFVIINFLGAILLFTHSYRRIKSVPDKKKLKWILFGFVTGPLSYIFFWVFPYFLFDKGLIPEFLVIGLLNAVPVTFAIAIIKYHFFDIDFIINRSVVYLIVLSSLVILYLLLFTVISLSVKGIDDTIPAVISVSTAALFLQPVKKRIQRFVDRQFFHVQYDYREALKKFLEEIDNCIDINSLAEKVVKRINEFIPVEKIGFFELQMPGNKIKLIAQNNFVFLLNRVIAFKRWELKSTLPKPVGLLEQVEEGVDIEKADSRVFNRWGMALVFPFRSIKDEIFGFLVLGKKKSGFRFTIEDIDLLNAVRSKVATTMERNKYQKELLMEQMEIERLEELNKMKSFIVSRVSHDFRTPLQSIGNFTQLLIDNKNYERNTVEKFLKIIEGESNRLNLMAEKVLDFSKIEKGIFEYSIEEISLNELVNNVIESLRYQLSMNKFTVEINLYKDDLKICADNIGIEAVLINLISNSIKYSSDRKVIKIFTGKKEDYVFVLIKDEGIGISKEDIDNIFNPFLRGNNIDPKKIKGAGLGLSIVKHIMDAHKGKVEVESEPGKGSSFTLLFPVI